MKNKTNTAYLIILDNESGNAAIHTIEGETLVGSGAECDIRLEADDVPPQYMRLMPVKDALLVRWKTNETDEIEPGYIGLGDSDYRIPTPNPIHIGERFVLQRLEEESNEDSEN